MTLLSDARSLLLQAANGTNTNLSEGQRSRMREVAWEVAPCTCGRGPDAAGHGVECLNGVFTPGYAKDSGWRPGRDDSTMSGHLDGPRPPKLPGPPDPPYIEGDLGAPSAEEFARRRNPAHSIRPVHGDVWACRAAPSQRFSVMHICGHHDPPHVTGYWNLHGGSGAGRHGEIPLPRFMQEFALIGREFEVERQRILALLDSAEANEAVVNALMAAVDAGADLGSEARAAITALVGLVEGHAP